MCVCVYVCVCVCVFVCVCAVSQSAMAHRLEGKETAYFKRNRSVVSYLSYRVVLPLVTLLFDINYY